MSTSSGTQTALGKAFEYICAKVISEKETTAVCIEQIDSPQFNTAKQYFFSLSPEKRAIYEKAAKAALRIVEKLEPKLFLPEGKLRVSLQTDSQGIKGDVRDVLCSRSTNWEIGFSCKHNHEAVKHSRLSDQIDFGKEWFGKNCSSEYFDEVQKVFLPLRLLRQNSVDSGIPTPLWENMPDKEDRCYAPILQAFMKELKRLDSCYSKEIPGLLVSYLIGRDDFYKIIMNENRRYTQIDSININGTLGQPFGRKKPLIDVPILKLPTKFYEIAFKDGSKNTIIVVCDNGWNISMRIHNADKKIEPSLKFDVRLIAMPSSIVSQIEPWE